jgi:acyl-CoA synthetase (AMP-forming)/AMP-acid ligase II
LIDRVEPIRDQLGIAPGAFIHFGAEFAPSGWQAYEALVGSASPSAPAVTVKPEDTWALMYTSGTTGRPKGAIRNHAGSALISLVTALDMGFARDDTALLVMPMCHANSLYFSFTFTYLGAACVIDDHKSFSPEQLLKTLSEQKVTFTSLVPTHYIMMLSLPNAVKRRYDVDSVSKLMISSAPARRETKLAIMEHFRNSQLFELYGSTEAGWVTILRPHEQLTKLGSVGREWTGSGAIKLLDPDGNEVPGGEVGELFSRTSYVFDGYWKNPEKTAEAFRGAWCSVGDMARRDEDGFYYLVDRKSNMIISGGENIYPSEVEGLLAPPGRQGRRGDRHAGRQVGRGRACGGGAACGRNDKRGRDARMVQEPHRGVQAAARDRLHRGIGHAADGHRQDPAPRVARQAHRANMTARFPRDATAPTARPDTVALGNNMGADRTHDDRSAKDYGNPMAPIPMATRIASV